MPELHSKITVAKQLKQSAGYFSAKNNVYNLVIVGSGISCTYTLIHYISLLKEKLAAQPNKTTRIIKVAIIDKSGEFWTGIPYGARSGRQSLMITPLKEFLPQPERDRFILWLQENYYAVFSSLKQRSGTLDSQWFKSYKQAMSAGNWDELFLPRYIFGWYLTEQVEYLLRLAEEQNYLQYDLVPADVCNIQKLLNGYQIYTTSNSALVAEKVILAIGSPPNKAAFLGNVETLKQDDFNHQNICSITNMYEPSQNDNVEQVLNFLRRHKFDRSQLKQVVIIGSNASALETLYSLNNISETAHLIDKFVIVSPSGEFPHPISNDVTHTSYKANHLANLANQESFTAKEIVEAVKQDLKVALEQKETIDSAYLVISHGVINAFNQLDYLEQKLFVTKYGVKIGKFQRRAGKHYLDVVDKLVFEGRIQFIKGKFTKTIPLAKGKLGFEFITTNSYQAELFTSPIQVLINCAGFQDLTKSSSLLIKNLIQQGICIPNDSLGGFEINENFEAQENFYLMGPLVAGNINERVKVWHAESCSRIFDLSRSLAKSLIR